MGNVIRHTQTAGHITDMSSRMSEDALRTQALVEKAHKPGKTVDDVINLYAEWAQDYEKDMGAVHYGAPAISAKFLASLYPSHEERKEVRVIDVAAGTGIAAQHLRSHGFVNIDATDISQEMLDEAKKKDLYKNYICADFSSSPTSIKADTYDALMAVGCFTTDHLTHSCFPEIRRIVKPGGHIVLIIRVSDLNNEPTFRDNFEKQIKEDVKEGLWNLIDRKVEEHYYNEDGAV